ncbi:hypothetical protein FEM54_25940 [Pseudomonas edaphica]|uniref:Uncharacterized protein n=1 Tax=Pseudomonas edaphica TaxID=2006980 RepID=A0ABY2TY54_9PSED|nr:hypothetical protein FEM54_25940 [Pseudomonas edaphica]
MEIKQCGSWLACDADTSVYESHRGDAIAAVRRFDKPAPTLGFVVFTRRRFSLPFPPQAHRTGTTGHANQPPHG